MNRPAATIAAHKNSGLLYVSSPLPLILFSGLGADERVFANQQREFPQLIVPPWRPPQRGDTLTTYCQRLAGELSLSGPVIVGGISFGGIVASEFARHVDARCCLLISSLRSPRQLPRRIRAVGTLRFALDGIPFRPIQNVLGRIGRSERLPISPLVKQVLLQLADADPRVVRWSIRQIFRFTEPPLTIPIHRIHGDRDPIFPLRYVQSDKVVCGGGHLLPQTHAGQINEFLRRAIATHGHVNEAASE